MQWLLQSTSPQISNLCTIQVDRVRKFSNQNEKQAETVYATCFFLKDLHQALNLREEKGSEKMTWKRILENAGIDIGFSHNVSHNVSQCFSQTSSMLPNAMQSIFATLALSLSNETCTFGFMLHPIDPSIWANINNSYLAGP